MSPTEEAGLGAPVRGTSEGRPSVGDLFADVSADLTTLLRQEVELAKAEVKQSAAQAGKGAGMFAGAGVAGHFVLLFASVAVWWGVGDHIGHGWAALVVAGFWLLVAAVLAALGRGAFTQVDGAPRTAETVKKIPGAIRGNEAVR